MNYFHHNNNNNNNNTNNLNSSSPPSIFHRNNQHNCLIDNLGIRKSRINIKHIQIEESQKQSYVLLNDTHSTTRTYGSLLWNQVKAMERLETKKHLKRSIQEKKQRTLELFVQEFQYKHIPENNYDNGNVGLKEDDKKHSNKEEYNEMMTMEPVFLRRLNQCEITMLYDAGAGRVFDSPGIPTVVIFMLKNTKQLYTIATEEEVETNIKSFRLPKTLIKASITQQHQKDEEALSSRRSTRDSITKRRDWSSSNCTTTTSAYSSSHSDHDDTTLSSSASQTNGTITMTVDQLFRFLTSEVGIPTIQAWKHIKTKFPQTMVGHPLSNKYQGDTDASNANANVSNIHSYLDPETTSDDEIGIAVGNDEVKKSESAHSTNLRQEPHLELHDHNHDTMNTVRIRRRSSLYYWKEMIGELDLQDQGDTTLDTLCGECGLFLDNFDDTIRPQSFPKKRKRS